MFESLLRSFEDDDVSVIVSHHWEFFYPNGNMNEALVEVPHAFAEYLATTRDVHVIRMNDASRDIR